MARYRIVKQEAVSGYNMDGSYQEVDECYVVLRGDEPIFTDDGIIPVLEHLVSIMGPCDRVIMDVEL